MRSNIVQPSCSAFGPFGEAKPVPKAQPAVRSTARWCLAKPNPSGHYLVGATYGTSSSGLLLRRRPSSEVPSVPPPRQCPDGAAGRGGGDPLPYNPTPKRPKALLQGQLEELYVVDPQARRAVGPLLAERQRSSSRSEERVGRDPHTPRNVPRRGACRGWGETPTPPNSSLGTLAKPKAKPSPKG